MPAKSAPSKTSTARPNKKPAGKPVFEKKTGERYASKAAMSKHEKSESKATQRKEAAKPSKKGK